MILPPSVRRLLAAAAGAVMLAGVAGCRSTGDEPAPGPPWFTVHPWWEEPGTLVVFMPRQVGAAKQASGDPLYLGWADALLDWVEASRVVREVVDEGGPLRRRVRISSKTIPSSDYSLLLVGPSGRGVHFAEPLLDPALYLAADAYVLGEIDADGLPPGAEALRLRTVEEAGDGAGEGEDLPALAKPAAATREGGTR